MYEERIRCKKLLEKVVSADEAAMLIKDGMRVGTSGFTPCGYPKAVPLALARQAREGRKVKIDLLTGASVGVELDGELTEAGVIARRVPYQTNEAIQKAINDGRINYIDQHLSHSPQQVRYGFHGKLDAAIIEAVAITEEGHIVPSTSMGNSPTFVQEAGFVIVEINTSQPLQLEGMHDVYIPQDPPNRRPIPIVNPGDRIGTPYIHCGPEKIKAIVVTDITDKVRPLAPLDDESRAMARNLIDFFKKEVKMGRLPKNLLPLQSGVGNVANAVLAGLLESDFENLVFYSEVIQDAALDMIDAGKFAVVSGTSLTPSEEGLVRFKEKIEFYRKKIILRPQEISNNPEIARRLGVISMNTAIEVDIYGHANSTHLMGTRMMNGIGGSGDFTRNAYLSVFLTASTAKKGNISCVVPMCSHIDHTEHDICVIVTEQGVADLRNKSPKERALEIINNCAHPDYKPLLREYFEEACRVTKNAHTPHLIGRCHEFHERFLKTGSMKK
ncbi:MAG: acetyl-CoA hydrolase/transferase family protein [Peptococcaceae bacterium]|jgi:succinyl-CoA:acetate CoA-transferase|nr:acetyl-CoA hydrolase/transferase family protein [Peptococcaceae bacterium]MDH7524278.1 acetyl-CoA hydrolase/transferase family protein [Peptococcaceae bacterium]